MQAAAIMNALPAGTGSTEEGKAAGLVSVVIPVYNAAPYLREALDSVLSQDYAPFELIVVDDGSTDASREILASYGDRLTVLYEQRRGPAAARNCGVRSARGAFIAFHDADDIWLQGKLREQLAYLGSHPDIDIVFSQLAFWFADDDDRYPDPRPIVADPTRWEVKQALSGYIYPDQLLESCIGMITPVVRRTVLDQLGGFDESLPAGSDYDFWLRATYRFRAHKLDRCHALYRIRSQSITSTPRRENYPALVLQRSLDRHGLAGPDGRRADASAVNARLAASWLNFALLHIDRGDRHVGQKAMWQFVRQAGWRPVTLIQTAKGVGRLVRRAVADLVSGRSRG